jgi:hypothetical protein
MVYKNDYYPDWVKKFAFFPVSVTGGRTVWLGYYEQRYVEIKKGENKCSCHTVGRWEYRLVDDSTAN